MHKGETAREIRKRQQGKFKYMAEDSSVKNWSTEHLPYSDKRIDSILEEKTESDRINEIVGGQ